MRESKRGGGTQEANKVSLSCHHRQGRDCEKKWTLNVKFFPQWWPIPLLKKGKEIKRIQDLLNERPRKTLDWLTSFEAFDKIMNKCSVKS